jgi:hypothetical protein
MTREWTNAAQYRLHGRVAILGRYCIGCVLPNTDSALVTASAFRRMEGAVPGSMTVLMVGTVARDGDEMQL